MVYNKSISKLTCRPPERIQT